MSIAKDSPMKIGWKATHIAIAGFVIPYMAVYNPALMLQGNWTMFSTGYVVCKALLAIALWGGAAVGYLWGPLKAAERACMTIVAILIIAAWPWTDEAGFAMATLFFVWHARQVRKLPAVA